MTFNLTFAMGFTVLDWSAVLLHFVVVLIAFLRVNTLHDLPRLSTTMRMY
jgi:hypothetical protein